ncbi:MAG: DNA translocase FtsK [Caldilineaceae bacterium]|nr:DNA translocase FtsK [Caldilineaceae bacterium]
MATKKRKKSKVDTLDTVINAIAVVTRPEVVGLSLIVISVFTLLSLFTDSRGTITGSWIDFLRSLTGTGVWGVPLLTGSVGLWMVIRVIEKMPDLPWQRPAALLLLFLAYVTGATLWIPAVQRAAAVMVGGGGGQLGLALAGGLESALSVWGAWAIVTFLGITGVILLTDRLLLDLLLDAWDALLDLLDGHKARREEEAIDLQPALPIPSGEIPWWKRILFKPRPAQDEEPIIQLPPAVRNRSVPANAPAPSPKRDPLPAVDPRPRQPLTKPSEEATLTPRVVGGVQSWQLPRIDDMLSDWDRFVDSYDKIRERGKLIEKTLELFGVPARFKEVNIGPTVTQYLIEPGYIERTVRGETKKTKIKVAKIAGLSNDLALALAAPSVRIEAPVPGTNYVGVEVPNGESNIVGLKELMQSDEFAAIQRKAKLPIALGEDVKGKAVVTDLARMPHALIAGATGSGKSACINSIISCLLLTHTPETLRMLMVDPKMVELTTYNGVPHLLSPVVTEVDRAAGVLLWAVKEMERRYQLLNKANTRDLERYNDYLRKRNEEILPFIVIIIDEMADLMMTAAEEVEKHVCRLAQMARAVGIHLIIATQRPSVDVITGLIKANFPTRIAFAVSSQTDSRVVLDVPGAERLLGRGDMLFMPPDASKLERLQGTYLNDDEINRIVRYWKGIRSLESYTPPTLPDVTESLNTHYVPKPKPASTEGWDDVDLVQKRRSLDEPLVQPLFEQIEVMKTVQGRDGLFDEAVKVVQEAGRGSVELLRRKLRIGYSRASRLIDQLEEAGILGPDQGGSQGRIVYLDNPPQDADNSDAPLTPRIIGDDDPPKIWM